MEAFRTISFLMIDDNRHMASIVRVLLRAFGVQTIHECDRPADAFTEFAALKPDMVIVDDGMPPFDAIDFIRRLRRNPESPAPRVPILLVTAHSERRRLASARDAGVTEILVKPVTAPDLFARLDAMVQRPRPFIDVPGYFGPCRRRNPNPNYRGEERRQAETALMPDDRRNLTG